MTKFLSICAIFALAACARVEPVDANALDVQDLTAVDTDQAINNGEGDSAELPVMSWQVDADARRATFGLSPEDPAFALRCDAEKRELELTRFAAGAQGTAGTMSLIGNGANLSVPVLAEEIEGRSVLRTQIGDATLLGNIKSVFAGDQQIGLATTGASPLTLEATDEVRAIVNACQPEVAPAA